MFQVNAEWLEGYSDGKQGIFPQGFVRVFPEVFLPPKGRIFICIEEFPELQPGDLALQPGKLSAASPSLQSCESHTGTVATYQ